MKKLWTLLALLATSNLWGEAPRLGVADFSSSTMEKGKLALVSETFRAELFKTSLFVLQDQPWVAGTKVSGLNKGASGSIESFGKTWVVAIKVVDLANGTLEFSETATVADESEVFRAVKELTSRLATRFRFGLLVGRPQTPEEATSLNESQWRGLGAEGATLTGLLALGESTDTYLSFRQYDGNITTSAYLELRKQGVDLGVLRSFLETGLTYHDSLRALSMGITRLEKYQSAFRPAGYEFAEYLDAYALGLSTPTEYKRYLEESERDFLSLGIGGVADQLPLGNTDFKFPIGQVAWEHSWMKSPRDWYRVNTEAGFILLGLFLPTPYFGINVMAGSAPFFVKAGIGGHSEMLLGGHNAINFRLGIEVDSRFEFTFLGIPFGNQPAINYVGGFQKWEGGADGPIKFPYFGLIFTYKLPLTQ